MSTRGLVCKGRLSVCFDRVPTSRVALSVIVFSFGRVSVEGRASF
jgi:hypothetical protein